jgi:hypothetical protein
MGTRGIIGYVIRGKRVGSYNHFDCYPEGMGRAIMEFLMRLSTEEKARFKTNLDKVGRNRDSVSPTPRLFASTISNARFG